jgi:DNA-binding MarR family transcriptional regulator
MKQMEMLETQIKEFINALNNAQTSINHMLVFSEICKTQPVNSADLIVKLDMQKSCVNRVLHSLSENGRGKVKAAKLINIEMDLIDRRQRNITLTDKGKKLMNKMFGTKK